MNFDNLISEYLNFFFLVIDDISIYKLNVLKVIAPIALLNLILGLIIPWNHKVNFTIE